MTRYKKILDMVFVMLITCLLVPGAVLMADVIGLGGKVTAQRTIRPPIPNPGGSATIFGSVKATADADGNAGSVEKKHQEKLTASGGPPNTLVTNSVIATVSKVSPITPGTTAFSKAVVDPTGSFLDSPDVVIKMKTTAEVAITLGLPPFPPGLTQASATARARDPIIFGDQGFGEQSLPVGASFDMLFELLDTATLDEGGTYVARQYVIPGAYEDPETLDNLPDGSALFFSLVVNHEAGSKTVVFTPGTDTDKFDFSFNRSKELIESDVLAFFGGADDLEVCVGTVKLKEAMNNVTLASEDNDTISGSRIPEPTTLALLAFGGASLLIRRRRK
ncbi:MAG: PEP-CTERM sorting domain-containing protein [Planctomycetota bacterium]|nr:PEP-CTERM sorting domain-containing protein [Planctomycetota bacterium]